MNELTYTRNGDVLIPNMVAHLPVRALGKYGRMHRKTLKEQHPFSTTVWFCAGSCSIICSIIS